MQYTPTSDVGKSLRPVQRSKSQWLYDTENQLVRMNKGKGRAFDTDSDMPIDVLHEDSMRYVISIRHEGILYLILSL
jgi:hypothetical protein